MNKRKISPLFIISLLVFLSVSVALYLSKSSYKIADAINSGISNTYRKIMAYVTGAVPFSVFELIVILLPVIIALVVILAVRRARSGVGMSRFILNLLACVLLILSGHNLALGVGYNTTPIDKKMDLPIVDVTPDVLASLMTQLRDEVNTLSEMVEYNPDGSSRSPYTLDEVSEIITGSYDDLSKKYGFADGFFSRAKPVHFSGVMSYFGITGIYTFYTGEANVNVAYPDYDVVFTAAHELSHQRGILREDEANFSAYLLCSESGDDYLRYSAALNLYQYVSSALYRTDSELYREINATLCDGAKGDILASRAVYQKYGDTLIERISTFINDIFLKSNGTEGVVSYGKVVRLAVAYYDSLNQ